MHMQYFRLAKGLVGQTSELLPVTHNIYKHIKKDTRADWYLSLYRYNDSHVETFKRNKSVAGITGQTTNRLFFDFDDAQNIENARKDAITICARLIEHGLPENEIRLFFSGMKGFAVEVITTETMTRQEFINITFNLASDLKTFDTRINDSNRIVRLPLTRHPKSGLYKIPLTLTELSSLSKDEITARASDNSDFDSVAEQLEDSLWQVEMPLKLKQLKSKEAKKIVTSVEDKDDLTFDPSELDFSKCPRWLPKERFALQSGFFKGSETTGKGERNTAFMILAATYRNQGFSADHALGLLMATAEQQAKRTGETPYTEEQMKREVLNSVYSPQWKGGTFGKDEELLIKTRERFKLKEIDVQTDLVKIDDVANRFKNFAKTFKHNQIKTGIASIDDNVLLTTGMLVGLLGSPGVGKTTLSNAFIENLSAAGTPVIYESLDMWDNLLYTRLLQKHSGYDMRKILDMYENDRPDKDLLNAYAQVIKNYSNVEFNFRSGPTVEQIEQDVINYKQTTGNQPKLLVVDYLEKVRGPFSDSTANGAYVASRLSDIAKNHDICVLLLLQPQKSAGDPREPLLSMRKIKGASVIEQDCRAILTMWRPGYDPQDSNEDNYMSIAVVKNNMGGLTQMDLGWHGLTGTFKELDSSERRELQTLRDRINQEKQKADGFDF